VQSAIFCVQPGGSSPPFFFLHGDLWGGLYCRRLARLLGPEQPFYAVMPDGFDGEHLLPSIEAIAEENIRRLVALQPQGPYLLGGYCNGALVAYEMATQMERQGLEVGTVIMLEAGIRTHFGWLQNIVHYGGVLTFLGADTQRNVYMLLRSYIVRMKQAYRQGNKALLTLCLQTARRKILRMLGTPPEKLGIPAPVFNDPLQSRRYNHLVRTTFDYQPQAYEGRVVLLRTKTVGDDRPWDRTAGWGKLAPRMEVYDLPGTHATCLTEHAEVVAGHIGRCLRAYHDADAHRAVAQHT
jgi:thioesterase domain-containing protein